MTGQQSKYTFHCGDVMKMDHHITNIDPETCHKVEGAIHKQAA